MHSLSLIGAGPKPVELPTPVAAEVGEQRAA